MQVHTIVRPGSGARPTPRPGSRRLRRRAGAGILAILATAGPASAVADTPSCPMAGEPPVARTREQAAAAVVCLVNRERARRDLPPLRQQPRLERAAERYSRDMVRRRFFSHTSPEGASVAERLRAVAYVRGARAWAVGETLAWGTGDLATPTAIVNAWLDSPRHRRVLLAPRYREVGVGAVPGVPLDVGGGLPGATYAAELGVRS
jgi:uncharacterized protein YkwD